MWVRHELISEAFHQSENLGDFLKLFEGKRVPHAWCLVNIISITTILYTTSSPARTTVFQGLY
jgi:hypothetical protein